ncbi:MAG TPA: Rne/Rng family ribonuclease [Terriglobales bacterium]|nr:Rne/Rng family ribonuclease [Terriglobales bacterium]
MSKELYVSSTPHETKVAVVEEDQLTEIYFERENEYTLAGSIYKGRVTRVLPGMQSAFVDVGLERDAFLYVTDFLEEQEDQDEFEQVVSRAHEDATRNGTQPRADALPPAEPVQAVAEEQEIARPAAAEPARGPERDNEGEGGGRWRGRRRRRGRGRGFPESKFARQEQPRPQETASAAPPVYAPPPAYQPIILPGESISKYQRLAAQRPTATEVSTGAAEQAADAAALAASMEPLSDSLEHEHQAESRPFSASAEARGTFGASAVAQERHQQSQTLDDAEQERFDQMNVAGVFAGEEAETEPEEPGTAFSARTESAHAPDEQHAAAAFQPGSGLIEEEEIEEDEADLPPVEDDLDVAEYEELEEETLDRDAPSTIARAVESGDQTEAMEDAEADADRAPVEAAGEFEEEGEEQGGEGEFEEEEAEAGASPGEATDARAETRGTPGTAGFQQRPQRQPFDRRRGGRRGGRGTHSRRNIQRGPAPKITDLLKEGQEILVQIAKEPIAKKGARITSHIALPGRFLVYMPTVNHIGVSRKIASDEERQRLKRVILAEHQGSGGFIVRTAAAGASDDDLRADVRFLFNLWTEIRNRTESSKAPALIYHDLNLVERILRDQVTATFTQIWVDTEQEYERVLRFVSRFQPGLVKRVKLYSKETPLFEQFNIQEEINKALKSKVWLKSGGYIVINQTEALVAIDVNTGKYVGKTTRLEDTIVKTNVDAIREIVRQIRLRDLGGIIVIDFIDMDERRNRQKVLQALEEELKHDRAPSKVLNFNDFGLVAITRKRVRQSLERTLGSPCPYCTGTGLVKSVSTICNEIYVEMRKIAKHVDRSDVMLRANPEVVKALKANGGRWLQEMEELTGRTVIVKSDPVLHQEQFDLN